MNRKRELGLFALMTGAFAAFVSQQSVMRYLGPNAPRVTKVSVTDWADGRRDAH